MKLRIVGSPNIDSVDQRVISDKGNLPGDNRNEVPTQRSIADFLRCLRIAFRDDRIVSESIEVRRLPQIDWHFAMPNTWKEEGEIVMRAAIEEAGFQHGNDNARIFYMSEAKAAAIGAADQLREGDMQVGDSVLVCDLGGITSDFTKFEVLAMDADEPRNVNFHPVKEESTAENASHMVETNLMAHICAQLELRQGPAINRKIRHGAVLAKHQFTGDNDLPIFIPGLTRTRNPNARNDCYNPVTGFFKFTKDSLLDAFKLVVGSIIERLTNHINDGVNRIVIVGGFSKSPYLRKRVKEVLEEFNEDKRPKVHYLPGNEAIIAVSYGLTLKGITISNPVQYHGPWGYKISCPVIEVLAATGLTFSRRYDFPIFNPNEQNLQEGKTPFRLSVERGQRVGDVYVHRFKETSDDAEFVAQIDLTIPDDAPRAEYHERGVVVYFYNLYLLWHFIEGVGLKMKLQVAVRSNDREETVGVVVGSSSHTVAEMVPWRRKD
ncbi:hypothetical protein AtubIFM55763_005370 [Aspergillus tubingensis]|nr:hypothetical protein AtubIFM55763_005370 [Aspergillus tubingensis]